MISHNEYIDAELRNLKANFALMSSIMCLAELLVKYDISPDVVIDMWRAKCVAGRQRTKDALATMAFPEEPAASIPAEDIPELAVNDYDWPELLDNVAQELRVSLQEAVEWVRTEKK